MDQSQIATSRPRNGNRIENPTEHYLRQAQGGAAWPGHKRTGPTTTEEAFQLDGMAESSSGLATWLRVPEHNPGRHRSR
ncbi:hypothetical protein NUU61_000041 [Penicillium alfredii]|uniref:Uncharacterized protein n=1 Tax=Penicillium alfredii TaxID=1506179 RepID=A0A9W9G960_9EURO|nr:uncharacterized protein NUU61_000041 [Penicillium alfredii]KAJ5114282.1 hypothetical protein NUU61_000041 [Penicillium alfredii]